MSQGRILRAGSFEGCRSPALDVSRSEGHDALDPAIIGCGEKNDAARVSGNGGRMTEHPFDVE